MSKYNINLKKEKGNKSYYLSTPKSHHSISTRIRCLSEEKDVIMEHFLHNTPLCSFRTKNVSISRELPYLRRDQDETELDQSVTHQQRLLQY